MSVCHGFRGCDYKANATVKYNSQHAPSVSTKRDTNATAILHMFCPRLLAFQIFAIIVHVHVVSSVLILFSIIIIITAIVQVLTLKIMPGIKLN